MANDPVPLGAAIGAAAGLPGQNWQIVAIGASAGGLDACRRLVASLPPDPGIALILVQHLDPTHESMLVELLASKTGMNVSQAVDGRLIEPDHLYVIPPGSYLSVVQGALRLSPPEAPHGARLPFDFLLRSLAQDCGKRAVAVVLSGTGADGALGVRMIHEAGGQVIVQDPTEAGYDGMPKSAIATGCVDLVLPLAEIAKHLTRHRLAEPDPTDPDEAGHDTPGSARLGDLIELLRQKTAHDFKLYKPGTLQRRVERRMGMAGLSSDNFDGYLALLRQDSAELEELSHDLLINVTGFFRDPAVFALLDDKVIPAMVAEHPPELPLRIWVAGCSTGEETYSLAMLFFDAIRVANRPIKLQILASDADSRALGCAREGRYPASIGADIPAARLDRYFIREEQHYRVAPDLRAAVIFTVQDVLADPPFSRLDMVSCRNLLIYLQPEAQNRVLSLFHFALREGGLLLLGSSEAVGTQDPRFQLISKPARLYRHAFRSRPGEVDLVLGLGRAVRDPARAANLATPSRHAALAELCRRQLLERFAPATVLINRRHDALYFMGPTELFLRVAPGPPSLDLLAMVRPELRIKLRAAIQQALQNNQSVTLQAGPIDIKSQPNSCAIEVTPLSQDGETLLIVCFIAGPIPSSVASPVPDRIQDQPRIAALEQELAMVRAELQAAIRNLEIANEEQTAINEDALSVNEEYQSTNEELLTSKEELQSLNEELTALNSQLQETLERQRVTANDLKNILFSTDVATLFLDKHRNIRFFTPATRLLFNVIPSDVGRPLADLRSVTEDRTLLDDVKEVLAGATLREQEIEGPESAWFVRKVLPYRTQNSEIEGVVITYADITERRRIALALETAKRQAELANIAKSRFLAAASHDLRQPLQTLVLLQGLLARQVDDEKAKKLVGRLGDTLAAMTGMLNTLLDINQIEAGTVTAEIVRFPLNELLNRLRDEFHYLAAAQGLRLKSVACALEVESDPRLLEQMIRNLLSNALKYTPQGKILLGCRRRGGAVSIEIWDSGIGIPFDEQESIFDEYHQIDNAAREHNRGLGLGLSIVRRLGKLLGHRVSVCSKLKSGSVFAIEITLPAASPVPDAAAETALIAPPPKAARRGTILLVEDDPALRQMIAQLLQDEGHHAVIAGDGPAAIALLRHEGLRPDLILADYNLPKKMNGLQLAASLREIFHLEIPVIILTGDISTGTLRHIAEQKCLQLNKPVELGELLAKVQSLLPANAQRNEPPALGPPQEKPVVFLVDDDAHVREAISELLLAEGRSVESFASCEAFLASFRPGRIGCLLIDARLPGMGGIELLNRLSEAGHQLPSIMITGRSDVPMAVSAMKAGAADFIEKPVGRDDLLASIDRAVQSSQGSNALVLWRADAEKKLASLTPRQIEIMRLVLAGHPSKNIAADLGISQRTVENHRASIMEKTGTKSLPALARLALAAGQVSGP